MNGRPSGEQQAGNGPSTGWVRVAELYAGLTVDPKTIRTWIRDNVPPEGQERRTGVSGGRPELWLKKEFVPPLRATYSADGQEASNGRATGEQRGANGKASGDQRAGNGRPTGEEQAEADGWKAALEQAKERVGELTTERDRLRAQLDSTRVEVENATRRAEEAERGRYQAETRLEALRATWWRWYALVQQMGSWARLRRRLPDPPAELTADRLLAPPERTT